MYGTLTKADRTVGVYVDLCLSAVLLLLKWSWSWLWSYTSGRGVALVKYLRAQEMCY